MEHVEQAGVHSGDSGCSLPPYSLCAALRRDRATRRGGGTALNVIGLMNVQFAIQDGVVYVLEVNPRASRTAPFVSKATGVPLAKIGARVMVGRTLSEMGLQRERVPKFFSVKEAVFPFNKFPDADPILGPEMKSTGEVMGTGHTFGEAYAKAQTASGVVLPTRGVCLLSSEISTSRARSIWPGSWSSAASSSSLRMVRPPRSRRRGSAAAASTRCARAGHTSSI